MQKPRITEIQVRIDCNGCVQKIKKALHRINGIYDFNIDFPQQKITITGWADPEKIVKAIKKTRKNAIICSQTEPPDDQPPQDDGAPPPDSANPPPEQPNDQPPPEQPKDPPPQEHPPPEAKPSPDEAAANQPSTPKDMEQARVTYHQPPPGHGGIYGPGQWNYAYPGGGPPQPIYVAHSYNTHRPSSYVTEYANLQPPPAGYSYHHHVPYHYGGEYRYGNGNLNIASMFSDENPNACTIV